MDCSKIWVGVVAFVALTASGVVVPNGTKHITIIPQPKVFKPTGGHVIVKEISPSLFKATRDAKLAAEGYRLSVSSNGVSVAAADDAGEFYALQSLRQLAEKAGDLVSLPCVEIEDAPTYRWRGLLLDEGRHFFGKGTVKRLLDLMAYHKLNVLHWTLTQDQGWRIEIKKYPRLVEVGARRDSSPRHWAPEESDETPYGPYFYTQDDIREIVAYAQARHIAVMPEIEIPGHSGAAIAAYPEFSCRGPGKVPARTRCGWGVNDDIYCAGNDATLAFHDDVLGEVCALFPAPYIHIGGDEAPKARWKECPKCQARIRREKLKDEESLQTWLSHRVQAMLEKRGKRIMGWQEMLDGGSFPGAAVTVYHQEKAPALAAKGADLVLTPVTSCYFDFKLGIPNDPFEYPIWAPDMPLDATFLFDPSLGIAPADRRHVLGGQGSIWSEYIWNETDLMWKAWPRGCALAEALWTSFEHRNYSGFRERLAIHLPRLAAFGIVPASN